MITLEAQKLLLKYEHQVALSIESLSVCGTVIAVLGHNGAGKSTLLKTLLGLLSAQEGTLTAKTLNPPTTLQPDLHMAFCPENGAVFEDIKVSDYLKIWLRLRGKSDSLKNSQALQLLELFEVAPLLKKFGRELSKGQRRRVQSVVGFLIEPKLFLFDEPFDGLDVQRTAELADIIGLYKEQTAFIISSHRMDIIERVSDAGVVLAEGNVVASGSITQISLLMAGRTLVIEQACLSKEILKELIDKFSLYHSNIGEHLVLTGPQANSVTFKKFLSEKNIAIVEHREFNPTLTDAMGYHLQKMRTKKLL